MTTLAEHRERTVLNWTEKQLQQQIIGLARTLGWWTHHHYDSRRSAPGWPDLVLLRDDRALFVELKAEKGRLSPDQRHVLDMIAHAGLDAHIWRPRHWNDGSIHQALGAQPMTPTNTGGTP